MVENEYVIGEVQRIRRELLELDQQIEVLQKRKETLMKELTAAHATCTHKNADGTSAVTWAGPGYDVCELCGEWF